MAPRKRGRIISQVGTLYRDRDERYEAKLPGQVRDWQVKCVCGGTHLTCNGGWMRDIENEAKPILLPLIKGTITQLPERQQVIIATWGVLKSIVSEYHGTSQISTHWTQRKVVKTHGHPPTKHWAVWIGNYERENWRLEWASSAFFVPSKAVQLKRGIREPTYYNACTTTQVIGKLFIQIVHIPTPFFTRPDHLARIFPPTNGVIARIWPIEHSVIQWPPRVLSDSDADAIAITIQTRLRAIAK